MRSLRLLFEPQLNTRNAIGCCRILCSLPAAHLGQRQRLRISVPHIRRISTFCLLQRSERKGVTLNKNHNKILEPLTLQEIYSLECKKRRFSITVPICQMRKQSRDEIVEAAPRPQDGQLTVGQKVKQAGKDASYMGVLLIGFGVTGVLIWYVLSELLFSFSPSSVYSKALERVKRDQAVLDAVGDSFKAYGEETSRGRRRHVSHQDYIVDGVNYMRVKFYISGSKRKGTVHVDAKETSRGNFDFRYIFVELDGYPTETIVVEDNR